MNLLLNLIQNYNIKEVYKQNMYFKNTTPYKFQYKYQKNKVMNRQNYTHGKTSNWIVK